MTLDPTSHRRLKILGFLRDSGGSCSDQEWKEFDRDRVQLDPYIEDLEGQGYVLHANGRYSLTKEGTEEMVYLESLPN